MNAGTLLSSSAQRYPDRVALWVDGEAVTYRDLNQRVNGLAHGLLDLGVGPGERLAIYANNSPEWVEAFFAASKIGAVVVPVSHRLRGRELTHILTDAAVAVVVCDGATAPELIRSASGLPALRYVLWVDDGPGPDLGPAVRTVAFATARAPRADEPPTEPLPTDIQGLNYTSGTTGLAKGAMVTHSNLVLGQHCIFALEYGLTHRDCILISAALAYRIGWGRLINAFGIGCPAVLMRHFDAAAVLDLIERHRVTVVGMVPTMLRMILQLPEVGRRDTSSVRVFHLTGEAASPEVKEGIRTHFPNAGIYTFFASTESGTATVLLPEDQWLRPGSTGKPMPGVRIRIVDDAGRDLPAGTDGEILVYGGAPGYYTVMHGYLNNPAATAAAFSGSWLHTGDIGHLDADGYLYITDRKKDMIISGGLNIYSKEVEGLLMTHPAVGEAAVIGVPDPLWGEAVKAYLLLRPGQTVTAGDLTAFCQERMAGYKRPRYYEFVADFPRNDTGKVLKRALKAAAAGTAPE